MTERIQPDNVPDERTALEQFLDYYRETLQVKCDGLTDEQLKLRSCPPSDLSLIGLVRHMAEVEHAWFRVRVNGEEPRFRYVDITKQDDNSDFELVDDCDPAEDFAAWREEIAGAKAVMAGIDSLDQTFEHPRHGTMNVRWVLIHMIEEYARHAGHADLLRERIDGATGY